MIGHRFGHQSGQDESSGQNSAAILIAYSFRVYLVFSKICINTKHQSHKHIFVNNKHVWKKTRRFSKEKAPAASLFSRKQGLGVPIHVKMSFILTNIYYYALLVLLISIILIILIAY